MDEHKCKQCIALHYIQSTLLSANTDQFIKKITSKQSRFFLKWTKKSHIFSQGSILDLGSIFSSKLCIDLNILRPKISISEFDVP